MMQHSPKPETRKGTPLSSEKINALRKMAVKAGARPVKLEIINAGACKQYYVGCNTIEGQR